MARRNVLEAQLRHHGLSADEAKELTQLRAEEGKPPVASHEQDRGASEKAARERRASLAKP